MLQHVLLPGTFDPPTLGHVDLVERAARLFPRVTVAVAEHPTKECLLGFEERVAILQACFERLSSVEVTGLDGLVVDACKRLGCQAIVRGIRSGADFDYEAQMATTNRTLHPEVDTLFLATSAGLAHLSSTLVRQIASMGGDVRSLVPAPAVAALRRRLQG